MIIDGKAIAQKINAQTKAKIKSSRLTPGLAVILVGDDPASLIYVKNKKKAAAEAGIHLQRHEFPASVVQGLIHELILELNTDRNIHGIIVQLPLPRHINTDKIIKAINPHKDADGFHPENLAKLKTGQGDIEPVLAQAILAMLKATGQKLKGLNAVVLANRDVFAAPLCLLLARLGVNCKFLNPSKPGLSSSTTQADILVSILGKPRFVTADFIKPGSIVIDVGTTKVGGDLVGDVDFENAKKKAAWITPVPGGVGPVTVAMLLKNVFELAKNSTNKGQKN